MRVIRVEISDATGCSVIRHICRSEAELQRISAEVEAEKASAPVGTRVHWRLEEPGKDTPAQILLAFDSIERSMLSPSSPCGVLKAIGMLDMDRYGVTISGLAREISREFPRGFRALCMAPRETQERIVTATRERLEREFQAATQISGR